MLVFRTRVLTQVFAEQKGEAGTAEALRLFQAALSLQPTPDEARAALYNSACCFAKQRQWQPAVDAVTSAVNDYDLKLTVAINVRFCRFLAAEERPCQAASVWAARTSPHGRAAHADASAECRHVRCCRILFGAVVMEYLQGL